MAVGAFLSLLKATSVILASMPHNDSQPVPCRPKLPPRRPPRLWPVTHCAAHTFSLMLKLVGDSSVTSSADKRRLIHRIKTIHEFNQLCFPGQ